MESPDAYKPLTFDLNDSSFQNETERLFSWKLFPNKFSSKKTVYEQTRNKRSLFVMALLINSKWIIFHTGDLQQRVIVEYYNGQPTSQPASCDRI